MIVWLSISSASILVRLSNAPGSICAFWRLFFTVLIILPFWFKRGCKLDSFSTISGLFLGLHFIFWMESLFLIPVLVSTVLVVTYPFYNLIFDRLLFHEKIFLRQIICLITGFVCVLMYFNPFFNKDLNPIGLILALLGGFFASVYFTIGRFARKIMGVDLIIYAFSSYTSGLIVALIYNLVYRVDLFNYTLSTYLYLVLMAIIPMLGGHTLMNYLLKYVKTSSVTAIALGEPVGAGLLAYFILSETVDLYKIILSSIIIFTLIMIAYDEIRGNL